MRRSSAKLARRTLAGLEGEPLRLLLVEDNARHVELMREAMGDAGVAFAGAAPYDLRTVGTLRDGLQAIADAGADLVLLDLSLPDASGLDALLRVRERYPDVPVIVLVGLNDETLSAQALQAGAQDYLSKGRLSGSLLARSIRYAVHLNRLQAALRSLSFVDSLTSLYNRRGFMAMAEPHVRLAQRAKGRFLVASADVVQLAAINAAAGHEGGDQVLRDVADLLHRTFRDSDLIARLEGGTFAVLALDAAVDTATIIAARLQHHVNAYNAQTIRAYTLAVRVGFTPFDPAAGTPIEDLLARAETARRESPGTAQHAKHAG